MADEKPNVLGATILTHRGHYFDFLSPETSQIEAIDIAHALSNCARYAGHTWRFYSVAQHCVYVSRIVPQEHAFEALMHDASEAYTGDITAPLKRLLPDFRVIEDRIEAAIAERFGLRYPWAPEIKHADMRLWRTEREDLMNTAGGTWPGMEKYPPADELARPIVPHVPVIAKLLWLKRFKELAPRHMRAMLGEAA